MSDRSKYSINGIYRCENFQQLLTQNDFPEFPMIPIGSAGGVDGWYITFRVELDENERFVYPFIFCHNPKPTFLLRRISNIIKKDGSSAFKKTSRFITPPGFGPNGFYIQVTAVLDGENGYLDDTGGLTVEYGIHVDAILEDDGIWKFNLNDPLFNSNDSLPIKHGVDRWRFPKFLYGHKQILPFHSASFQDEIIFFRLGNSEKWEIEMCLQMAHGVRIQFDHNIWMILWIAHFNKLRNVIQYVDQDTLLHIIIAPPCF